MKMDSNEGKFNFDLFLRLLVILFLIVLSGCGKEASVIEIESNKASLNNDDSFSSLSDADVNPQVLDKKTKQILKNAPFIIRARVMQISPRWETNAWGDKWVYSYITLQIEKIFKGSLPQAITLRNVGGNIGEMDFFVSDGARFREGEHALLFMNFTSGYYQLVSGERSKYVYGADGESIFVRGKAISEARFLGKILSDTKDQ